MILRSAARISLVASVKFDAAYGLASAKANIGFDVDTRRRMVSKAVTDTLRGLLTIGWLTFVG
jgi:hypothetical protein